ncbi:unnamed protein product [Adineta ricciae]|uniref:NAD(+)--protein-arginine ADP-ribosyltransferase n=1 Tax=Adineta ricciae TaxID=249248 RepID=A0A815C919_ADIRI|nr:unnamed protein product [Adineta ricciae]CAF1356467.1 unnamed protein product [Adineta ricciae]
MGNLLISCCRSSKQPEAIYSESATIIPIARTPKSAFYEACRGGNTEKVRELLLSLSLDEINRIEPNGSTALHAACYFKHPEIVKLLLEAGACRSIRNRLYQLTPYQEAGSDIRKLFFRVQLSTSHVFDHRFVGKSGIKEWTIVSKEAEQWKDNLNKVLVIQQSIPQMFCFLRDHYIIGEFYNTDISLKQKEHILWFFNQAILHNDVKYILKAYTSATKFHSFVNNHFADNILRLFRWRDISLRPNTLETCIEYLASILIYHSDLQEYHFTGTTYRGVLMTQEELSDYAVGKRLLTKTFLSTSLNPVLASIFAGVGDAQYMRRTIDDQVIQSSVLCKYTIINENTSLRIDSMSEFEIEQEVLILPLSAFQVQSVKQHLIGENVYVQIELVECSSKVLTIP